MNKVWIFKLNLNLIIYFRFSVFGLFAVIISWLTASIYLTAAVVSNIHFCFKLYQSITLLYIHFFNFI